MTGRFADKAAVVTGAAAGIGRSIVEQLSAGGAQVLCTDLDEAGLDELKVAMPELETIPLNMTDESDVERLVSGAVERFGKIDMAFNVVGGARPGYLLDLTAEEWQASIDLTMSSVFFCLKHEGRHMVDRGRGAIVNVGSLNSLVPQPAASAYAAPKAGVEMLTRNAALEYTPEGVRVNAVLPGLVRTQRTARFLDDEAVYGVFKERIPMGRAADPEEIAPAALFLASDEASYISGASLVVDGGWAQTVYPDLSFLVGKPAWLSRER